MTYNINVECALKVMQTFNVNFAKKNDIFFSVCEFLKDRTLSYR